MTRRYTGRLFARYSSVPLIKASLASGCTQWPACPASQASAPTTTSAAKRLIAIPRRTLNGSKRNSTSCSPAGTGTTREGAGVFEHGDFVVGIDVAVLGFRLAEQLLDRTVSADRGPTIERKFADRQRRANDDAPGAADGRIEGKIRKREVARAWLRA